MNVEDHAKIIVIIVMLIFGSIGVFIRNIALSSAEIALLRATIGSIFLIGSSLFFKQEYVFGSPKRDIPLLCISGAALGINWIFLFQAYASTSIANATLSYYFAPIFVIILAPPVLKERLTLIRVACVFIALFGLFLIVKAGNSDPGPLYDHTRGITYGLLAAVFYASVTLMNKYIDSPNGFGNALVQLVSAALILLPYVLLKNGLSFSGVDANSLLLIFIVGILHTGIAYFFYFSAIKELKGQTIAVLSYIDPVSAVIIAALLLGEGLNLLQAVGGILILGSTFFSEKLEPAGRAG
ncbi:MAG: EamA family transporter [Firmicutes bacterium]|nr:EamA family transporter [Bacillota bacterium]